jgi:hypothetical protein
MLEHNTRAINMYRLSVQLCTAYQYNYTVQATSTITLYRLPVQLHCTGYQYNYTVQATSTITLYRLPVQLRG